MFVSGVARESGDHAGCGGGGGGTTSSGPAAGLQGRLADALRAAGLRVFTSEDAMEGPMAFAEKRAAVWKAR